MTITRIFGDIHGYYPAYVDLIQDTPVDYDTVQIGDMGLGFGSMYFDALISQLHHQKAGRRRFIRGNHDDPEVCSQTTGYIADGTVEDHTMYIGGAWSIDWHRRKPGVSWWPDEELSQVQLDELIEVYKEIKPAVMFTHDAPAIASLKMFIERGDTIAPDLGTIHTRTGDALQTMWEFHQPAFWFFGHWHATRKQTIGDTVFQCVGQHEFVDFNLEKLEYVPA